MVGFVKMLDFPPSSNVIECRFVRPMGCSSSRSTPVSMSKNINALIQYFGGRRRHPVVRATCTGATIVFARVILAAFTRTHTTTTTLLIVPTIASGQRMPFRVEELPYYGTHHNATTHCYNSILASSTQHHVVGPPDSSRGVSTATTHSNRNTNLVRRNRSKTRLPPFRIEFV
jgi:hypothetical protein